MQKQQHIKQRGSALAGTLGLAIMISLGATAFLLLSASGINDESHHIAEEFALQAGESGLLLGTRWLRAQPDLPNTSSFNIFSSPLTINGAYVFVDVLVSGGRVTVQSTAWHQHMAGTKRLSWQVEKIKASAFGTFIKTLTPGGDVGGDGLNNVTLDGPFHANEPVILSSVSNPTAGGSGVLFKNGPVSVFNHLTFTNFTKKDPFTTGDWGNYGTGAYNNYDFGVYDRNVNIKQNAGTYGDHFDKTFTDIYRHSQDSLTVGPAGAPDLVLNSSATDASADDAAAHRPTLVFNADGSALYYRWTKSGATWGVVVDSLPAAIIDGKLLRVPDNDVNIIGTVNGRISVVTDTNHSIFVTGDLVYKDYVRPPPERFAAWDTSGNYGIGDVGGNANLLGLLSGKDLFVAPTWIDPRDGGSAMEKPVTSWYSPSDTTIFYMASLVAVNPEGNIMWKQKKGGGTTSIDIDSYPYKLRYIGSRCIDHWYSYSAGGETLNKKFRFYYDSRLSDGLAAPGMPDIFSASSGLLLSLTASNWQEVNF